MVDVSEAQKKEEYKKLFDEQLKKANVYYDYTKNGLRQDSCRICFLLDITGSMQDLIRTTKEKIDGIMQNVKNEYKDFIFEVAFIGYRDVKDTKQFERFPDPEEMKDAEGNGIYFFEYQQNEECQQKIKCFLESLKAEGGGDSAEDINGAFQFVLTKMNWNRNINILIHCCDAPAHGSQLNNYQTNDQDNYLNQPYFKEIDYKLILENMNYFGIHYFFLPLKPENTNKMFEYFNNITNDKEFKKSKVLIFEQQDIEGLLQDTSKFSNIIASDISVTIKRYNRKK